MVLQKEGLTYCFFFPPLTIVKIETRQIYKVFPVTEFILLRVVVNNVKANWDFC